MKLAVLLLSCNDTPRMTDFDRGWVHNLVGHVAGYYLDQSGGRVNMEFRVFDWFQLPLNSQQWNDLEFGAGPVVRPMVEKGLGVDLSPYSHFALVIDKFDANSAAVSPLHPNYVHVGGQSLTPALLQHELGHFFGAGHADLDTISGPEEYGDRFGIMGREGDKFSFVHKPLIRPQPNGNLETRFSASGPGMAAPSLRACGWLDLAHNGIDISDALTNGSRRSTVKLAALRSGPVPGTGIRVCAFADGVVSGQRLLLEYRSRNDWDRGMPGQGSGWVVAHLTGPETRSRASLQIGAVEATPGATAVTSKGSIRLVIHSASADVVTVTAEITAAAPAVASWGRGRLDIFGVGRNEAAFHKAWANAWHPSLTTWEDLGGGFMSPLSVSSWGPDRLDIFGIGLDRAMWHKAWANGWHPGQEAWESLGGELAGPPAVASWGPGRLDIFGLGMDRGIWHKAWANAWHPGQEAWEDLGGAFITPPAVCSWGPGRLDIFGVGLDKAMYHKAWDNGWHPSPSGWESLGGGFTSTPVACSWGPGRIDIFGIGVDGAMYHKAWDNGWYPSPNDWEYLGGKFVFPPAVASWGSGRIDIFGIGVDGSMYHKAWDNEWYPSPSGWELLGGGFVSQPAVVAWGPERLDIFAIGRDFGVWHKAWDRGWVPSPTEWESLGGGFI